jgi:hypothetical protein
MELNVSKGRTAPGWPILLSGRPGISNPHHEWKHHQAAEVRNQPPTVNREKRPKSENQFFQKKTARQPASPF